MTREQGVKRGDVWHFALDPVVGSEEAKTRPCVVVQRDSANLASPTTIVCPLASAKQRKANALNILVTPPEGGVTNPSLIRMNHVRAVDKARIRGSLMGTLSERTMALVDHSLRAILDLGDN